MGLRTGPGDGDGRRSRAALRLLGGDRRGARAGAGRARARRPGCLAQPARLRRHEPHLRRHQRPPLLRSRGLADRPAVVLLHRQAVVHGRRRARSQVGGGLLRPHRALRPGGLSAARAGVSRPSRMAHGALGERRGRRAGHRHPASGPPSSPTAPDRPASPRLVRVWDIRRTHGGWDGEWIVRDESFGTDVARKRASGCTSGRSSGKGRSSGPAGRPARSPIPVEPAALRRGALRRDGDGPLRGGQDPHRLRSVAGRHPRARRESRAEGPGGLGGRTARGSPASGARGATVGEAASAAAGSSEQFPLGASERHWRAASELRLGRGLRGLSARRERAALSRGERDRSTPARASGAAPGASERRFLGASEWLERGASEVRYAARANAPCRSERAGVDPGASETRPRYPARAVTGRVSPHAIRATSRSSSTPTCRSSGIPRTRR